MQVLRLLLLPLSWIYGLVVWIRNLLFDLNILKQHEPAIPCLAIGNLSFGGTGKTPMTLWFVNRLSHEHKIAVLSRGYGRSTKGFIEVKTDNSPNETGDEPLMIKRRKPEIGVFCCEDRIEGVKRIAELGYQLVILDDAIQHRRLKPSISVLLTSYSKPYFKDFYFPSGSLRDWKGSKGRCNSVVVTKCPSHLDQSAAHTFESKLGLIPTQQVAFSTILYKEPLSIFEGKTFQKEVVLVTGIENPEPFVDYCELNFKVLKHLKFRDHHRFSKEDIDRITRSIGIFANSKVSILTTEKDMVRLLPFENELARLNVHYLPIEMEMKYGGEKLDSIISDLTIN